MRFLSILLLISSLLFSGIELPQSFRSNFKQMITNPKGKVINYSGKIFYSKDRLFKWIYTKPTKKEVCTNKFKLTVVDHDLEQVSIYNLDESINIGKILKRAKRYRRNVFLAKYKNKNYTIQLYRSKLHSIAYFDDLDNKVQIVFKRIRYKQRKFSKNTMRCKYPYSYDVIR